MNLMTLPLAISVFFSLSTLIVPLKCPWTESRRSSEARFDRSSLATLADHDGTQIQAVARAGLLDEQSSDQATDTPEAVEDDVAAAALRLDLVVAGHVGERCGGELADRESVAVGAVGDRPADRGRSSTGPKSRSAIASRNGNVSMTDSSSPLDLPGEAVSPQNADDRLVHQRPAVQQDRHTLARGASCR